MYNPKRCRAGAVAVVAATMTYAITFSTPLASVNYRVTLQASGTNLGNLTSWISGKTMTGFTLNLAALAVSGSIDWIAVEDC